jgi:hypothetical protein
MVSSLTIHSPPQEGTLCVSVEKPWADILEVERILL